MKVIVLKEEGTHFLLARLKADGSVHEYVECSNYDPKKGDWDWGHYFWGLDEALRCFNGVE